MDLMGLVGLMDLMDLMGLVSSFMLLIFLVLDIEEEEDDDAPFVVLLPTFGIKLNAANFLSANVATKSFDTGETFGEEIDFEICAALLPFIKSKSFPFGFHSTLFLLKKYFPLCFNVVCSMSSDLVYIQVVWMGNVFASHCSSHCKQTYVWFFMPPGKVSIKVLNSFEVTSSCSVSSNKIRKCFSELLSIHVEVKVPQ